MSSLIYEVFTCSGLLLLGVYHMIFSIRNFLKSPREFTAKPFHPFPLFSRLRLLPLYIIIAFLVVCFLHQSLSSFDADPLLKGHTPVHTFTSLQSSAVSLLFMLICFCLLLSETTSAFSLLPIDLFFALSSAAFFLHSSVSSSRASVQTSDLQARCDTIAARVSFASSALCLLLALLPRLFVADVALAGSVCLQGIWALQTGLSLYVDAFIPEGCHRLLDVVRGVEGSTKCDLEESKLRAVALLDFAFIVHVIGVVLLVFLVYFVVSKVVGVSRRFGSYEPLPNNTADVNHVQLKTLSGTQA